MDYTVGNLGGGCPVVVYVDLAFAINFCIDAMLLYATAILFHAKYTWYRIFLAAAMGSAYAVATLFPGWQSLAATPYKLAAAFLMIMLSTGTGKELATRIGWRNLSLRFIGFLGVSAASGGMLFAMQSLFTPSSSTLGQLAYVHQQVVWWTSLDTVAWSILFPFAGVLALSLFRRAKRGWRTPPLFARVRLRVDGESVEVRALIDSGNLLKDPIAHLPVAMIKIEAAKSLLPLSIYQLLHEATDPYQALHAISTTQPEWAGRWYFIPFQGIGGKSGVMLGVKLGEAVMLEDKGEISLLPMMLGFMTGADFPQADFECILPFTRAWKYKGGTDTDANAATSSGQTIHTTHTA